MKAIALLAILLIGCSSSCAKPSVTWPSVVSCTEPAHADMLASVQHILADPAEGDTTKVGDRAIKELEAMAKQHGPHVVACLVDTAVRSFEADKQQPMARSLMAAPADAGVGDKELAAARGRDFLKRVAGTRVERSDGGK